jgi:hypothetical protein
MNTAPALSIITLAFTASTASASVVVPFTETFSDDNANWADQASQPLDWVSTGGADGGGYVTNTFNFVDSSPGGFPQILFRGQANLGSSDGAFVGDWLAGGINHFSFHIRHDAPVPLVPFVRFATPGNFPSANVIFPNAVEPGAWVEVTLDITPDNPLFVFSGGPDVFYTVFGNMGNIQIGVEGDPLFGQDIDVVFDLDLVAIASVPAPGVLSVFALTALCGSRRRRS